MTPDELELRIRGLKVWRRRDERAPHKPLLLLYAIGRALRGNEREVQFEEVDRVLSALLAEFGPTRNAIRPEYPFWRLRNDGIWRVAADGNLPYLDRDSDVRKSELVALRARGGFVEEVQTLIVSDARLASRLVNLILEASFPKTLHAGILAAVHLERVVRKPAPATLSDPGKLFRSKVLDAYGNRCALFHHVASQSGVDGVHIKWRQAGGPDDVENGLCLCAFHRKLFERGLITIDGDNRVVVSELASGCVSRPIVESTHGQRIQAPRSPELEPAAEYLEWHTREVFRGTAWQSSPAASDFQRSLDRRWHAVKTRASVRDATLSIGTLPARAARLVTGRGVSTAAQLAALNPRALLHEGNVGRGTLEALVHCAEACLDRDRPEDGPPGGTPGSVPAPPLPCFVEVADAIYGRLSAMHQKAVVLRFNDHLTLSDIALQTGVTRERVRQIGQKYLARLRGSISEGKTDPAVGEGGVNDFDVLCRSGVAPVLSELFYLTCARGCFHAEGHFRPGAGGAGDLKALADDLKCMPAFVLGRLTGPAIAARAGAIAPALCEWPSERLHSSLAAHMDARWDGSALRPRHVSIRRLILAVLTDAGGQISLDGLRQRCLPFVHEFGLSKALLAPDRLRHIVATSSELHLASRHSIVLTAAAPESHRTWREMAVAWILSARKPVSISLFLHDHDSAPLDKDALGSMLNADPRVKRIGRRLYASASAAAKASKATDLIAEALATQRRPWSHRELLAYVRARRHLASPQVENLLNRMPAVVRYSAHVVGTVALTRDVMVALLACEQFVIDRFRQLGMGTRCKADEVWLDEVKTDRRMDEADCEQVVLASRTWRRVRVRCVDELIYEVI